MKSSSTPVLDASAPFGPMSEPGLRDRVPSFLLSRDSLPSSSRCLRTRATGARNLTPEGARQRESVRRRRDGRTERSLPRLFVLCLSQLTYRLSGGPHGSIPRWAYYYWRRAYSTLSDLGQNFFTFLRLVWIFFCDSQALFVSRGGGQIHRFQNPLSPTFSTFQDPNLKSGGKSLQQLCKSSTGTAKKWPNWHAFPVPRGGKFRHF